MAELLYQKTQPGPDGAAGNGAAGPQPEGEAASTAPNEDVIDAEFKESK